MWPPRPGRHKVCEGPDDMGLSSGPLPRCPSAFSQPCVPAPSPPRPATSSAARLPAFNSRQLDPEDLPLLTPDFSTEALADEFERRWRADGWADVAPTRMPVRCGPAAQRTRQKPGLGVGAGPLRERCHVARGGGGAWQAFWRIPPSRRQADQPSLTRRRFTRSLALQSLENADSSPLP